MLRHPCPGREPALSGPTVSRLSCCTLASEPPPAPMARISTIGMRTGMRSTSPCMTTLMRPLRTTETSKLVPPMSTPMRLSSPRILLSSAQAALPPDGPESRRRTGSSAAVLAAHTPPFDCTRSNRGPNPSACIRCVSFSRYPAMTGISSALSTVVDVRSYSRISALNALEHDTLSAGRVFARYSAMRCSCSGLR